MNHLIVGYSEFRVEQRCPYCSGRHWALEDDGDLTTYRLLCWCGAKARVSKEDPDLMKELNRLRLERHDENTE